MVAAYRDRYSIISDAPIGAHSPASIPQQVDAARARSAVDQIRRLVSRLEGSEASKQRQATLSI